MRGVKPKGIDVGVQPKGIDVGVQPKGIDVGMSNLLIERVLRLKPNDCWVSGVRCLGNNFILGLGLKVRVQLQD